METAHGRGLLFCSSYSENPKSEKGYSGDGGHPNMCVRISTVEVVDTQTICMFFIYLAPAFIMIHVSYEIGILFHTLVPDNQF